MIPLLAVLRVERPQRRPFRLMLPVFLLWLLALPVLIVALPIVAVILLAYRRNPLQMFGAYWQLLCAIPGTHVEMSGRNGRNFGLYVY